nr:MAG TPA: adenine-specific methyltransferase [Bacteriophage sp.]
MKLLQGDCLELMKDIPGASIDMICVDPPYGTTHNKWDNVIDPVKMWAQFNRIIKERGAILIFSQLPFAVDLINANRKMFKYEIVWAKTMPVGFLNANRMPLRAHENILIFYKKLPTYNPQKIQGEPYVMKCYSYSNNYYGYKCKETRNFDGLRYPTDVLKINNHFRNHRLHPTEKPVALLEWLVKTYTNPGDVVLDACMGSGSTGVACLNTGRKFIGIERDPGYFAIASDRLEHTSPGML